MNPFTPAINLLQLWAEVWDVQVNLAMQNNAAIAEAMRSSLVQLSYSQHPDDPDVLVLRQ